jgi:cholesterol transport system auxiliary component
VRLAAAPALAALLALGGCSATLWPKPEPLPALYTLDPGAPVPSLPAQVETARPILAVTTPSAAPGFDTTAIVYQRRPQQLEHFATARWVEPPAQMLAPLITNELQRRGAFAAVVPASAGTRADLRLDTELVRLQQQFDTSPSRVRLTLRALLVDVPGRRVLATGEFDRVVDAASDDPYGGVVAAQRALQLVLDDLARFAAQRR